MLPSELAQERLRRIYLSDALGVTAHLRELVAPRAREIASIFYHELMELPDCATFLSHDLVKTRLVGTLAEWLGSLFTLGSTADVERFVQHQAHIGALHARLRVPPDLVLLGAGILRRELAQLVLASVPDPAAATTAVVRTGDLIDCAVILIIDSYFRDALRHEREAWGLQSSLAGPDGAVECERVRAALFDWQRQAVEQLLSPADAGAPALPTLADSDFGRWLRHKGEFLLGDPEMLVSLSAEVVKVDALVAEARRAPDAAARRTVVGRLDPVVANLATVVEWASDSLRRQAATHGAGTRLLDDRFLSTVLQRHARTSAALRCPFALVLLAVEPIDAVAAAAGDAAADVLLHEVGAALVEVMRASDFLFRYPKRRLLAVLGGATRVEVKRLAENLRWVLGQRTYSTAGAPVHVTTSAGVAVHDGHPDYHGVLRKVEEALEQALGEGGDRIVVA